MADLPGRPAYQPEDREDDAPAARPEDQGWGSPLPAEYGSLHAVRPPGEPARTEPRPQSPSRGSTGRNRTGRGRAGEGSSMAALLRRIQGVEPVPATAQGPGVDGDSTISTEDLPTRRPEPTRRSAEAGLIAGLEAEATGWVPTEQAEPEPTVTQAPVEEIAPDWAPGRLSRRERNAARRAALVRSRATVRHINVASVAKVSLIFYLIMLVVVVVAAVLLWYAANAFGTLTSFEKSIRTLFSLKSFSVRPATVALYTGAGGGVLALAGTLANILLAFVYNLISDVVGGVRIDVDSHPSD